MNSSWNAKKNCATEIIMTPEAAAMLNFGSSPFILKDGEDKQSRQKKERGVIERGNLRHDDIGGVEADDLASLGDVSNTETVFEVDGEEYDEDDVEDDDVSCLDDEEVFGEYNDDDESTVGQEKESDDDVEMEDESGEEEDDQDSAFSTKSGLDKLKNGGRKIGVDTNESDKEIIRRGNEIRRLEKEKAVMQAAFEVRMKQMEIEMQQKMQAMMASALGSTAPTPGVEFASAKEGSSSPSKEGDNSQQAGEFEASAAIK
jgi:hypothetical protein